MVGDLEAADCLRMHCRACFENDTTDRGDQTLCSSADTKATRWQRIYRAVRTIPPGRVATYGQVADLAGLDGHARQVGYALHALTAGEDVPWHRVVNARGEVSERSSGDSHELQRLLLEAEGVEFDARGRIDLKKFRLPLRKTRERISARTDR
jgi:methylated-DNA-protein-cysteine methyltransferase-like protein